MNISVIAIGDELLIGQVTDTNSGDIARIIAPMGWSIKRVQVVSDDAEAINKAIDDAFAETDVILTTGGLGPTKDDITKGTLCKYFGGKMVHDPAVLENIKEVFRKRGIALNRLTEGQAMVPDCCRVIQNKVGTAPIMWFERGGKVLVSMPGVPFETHRMFVDEVFPQLLEKFPQDICIEHRTLIVAGLTESKVAMRLEEWENSLPEFMHLAYLPKPGIIRLRLDGRHTDRNIVKETIDRLHRELTEMFADNLIASDDLTASQAAIARLKSRGLTVSTAESCTGGNIAASITANAGCSEVYSGSVVSYSNDVKEHVLGVSHTDIEQHGAVSREVARQMSCGASRVLMTDCAISTTGIAGPGGGSAEKPVGTVWISIAVPREIEFSESVLAMIGGKEALVETIGDKRVETAVFHLPGTRDRVIERATSNALSALALLLK